MRCAQAGEGGDKVYSAAVSDCFGKVLNIGGRCNNPQVISQPLDHGAPDKDAAFQGVGNIVFDFLSDR